LLVRRTLNHIELKTYRKRNQNLTIEQAEIIKVKIRHIIWVFGTHIQIESLAIMGYQRTMRIALSVAILGIRGCIILLSAGRLLSSRRQMMLLRIPFKAYDYL
jgi:hypothetical protein